MLSRKKTIFGALAIALLLAVILFARTKAGNTNQYDSAIIGDWQISSIVGDGEVPEQYLDDSFLAQVIVKDDHTGTMQYGPQQISFHWRYGENYKDGSISYLLTIDDGRKVGAILVGDTSEEYPDYRGMLGINIANDTIMAFERTPREEKTAEAA